MFLLPVLLAFAQAQSDTVRLAERLCAGCVVSLDRVVTLGDDDGPGAITFGAGVVVDARGRFWLGHAGAPAEVLIFSSEGRWIRTIGRSGGGPGEYRRIWRMTPFANGMVLWDDFAKRSTVVDLDFRVLGTRPAPDTPESVVLRSDLSGIMSAVVPTSDLIGFTLHEFDSAGHRLRSFGQTTLPYRESMRELFLRGLSPAMDTTRYWSSHRMEYAFALCNLRTDACREFLRPANWFPRPRWGPNPNMAESPPTPRLRAVSQDDSRFVWAILWVPDARWRTAVEQVTATEYRVTDFNRYYDTVVERIDVAAGRVVAQSRFDVVLWEFCAPGVTWWRREDADDIPRLEIVRLRLKEDPSLGRMP